MDILFATMYILGANMDM